MADPSAPRRKTRATNFGPGREGTLRLTMERIGLTGEACADLLSAHCPRRPESYVQISRSGRIIIAITAFARRSARQMALHIPFS